MLGLTGAAGITGMAGCIGGSSSGSGSNRTSGNSSESGSGANGGKSFVYGNDKSFVGATDIPFLWTMWEKLPQKYGHTAEVNLFEGMGPLTQAMSAGSIDIASSSIIQPANMRTAGRDIKLIGVETGGSDYVHVVNTNLASSFSDFVGANDIGWGYSGAGGNSHLQPASAFLQNDLDLGAVTFRKVGDSSTRTSALAGGNLAGASIHWDQWLNIKDAAPVKNLGMSVEILPGWIDGGVYAPSDWLNNNSEVAVDLLAAGIQGFRNVRESYDWYFNLYQEHKQTSGDVSRSGVKSQYKDYLNRFNSWPLPQPLERKTVENIVEVARHPAVEVLPEGFSTSEFVDLSYQKQAMNRKGNWQESTSGSSSSNVSKNNSSAPKTSASNTTD